MDVPGCAERGQDRLEHQQVGLTEGPVLVIPSTGPYSSPEVTCGHGLASACAN